MTDLESPTPSVAEGESPLPEGNSSEAVGVGEAVQQAEPVGRVEGQAADAAQAAEGQQPQAEQPNYEETPKPGAGEKFLREYGERWETKARGYEQALAPFGGAETFQAEYVPALQTLENPAADIIDKFAAIQRIDPTFQSHEFVSVALDAMTDEMAAPILKERAEDAVQVLFGDIIPNLSYADARLFLENYAPEQEQLPDSVRRELEAARQERQQFQTERERAQAEARRTQEAEHTRQLSEAQLSLGKRMWETPTEHVIGKLKFTELPADAPESVKQDFSRAQGFVRTQAQLATINDPQAQNLLRLVEGQVAAAVKAPPEQRQALMARAERTAAAVAQIQQAKAVEVGTFIKRLLDDSQALRASQANNAVNQRAEVAGAGGGGVSYTGDVKFPDPTSDPLGFQRAIAGMFNR
jgi:hypothetical protein